MVRTEFSVQAHDVRNATTAGDAGCRVAGIVPDLVDVNEIESRHGTVQKVGQFPGVRRPDARGESGLERMNGSVRGGQPVCSDRGSGGRHDFGADAASVQRVGEAGDGDCRAGPFKRHTGRDVKDFDRIRFHEGAAWNVHGWFRWGGDTRTADRSPTA